MRPLYHPPLSEVTVEGILYALSDPTSILSAYQIQRKQQPTLI